MNKIEAVWDKSEYDYDDFLNFNIDGTFLDELLDKSYPDQDYKGLVPTISYLMNWDFERKIVWERILPANDEMTICPILMCPDDCDFSCTIVVAKIIQTNDMIIWERIGSDISEFNLKKPELVGTSVKWFDKVEPLAFELSDYKEAISVFRKQMELDDKNWDEREKSKFR